MALEIEGSINQNSKADETDIRAFKIALNRLGFYTPLRDKGITGAADDALFDSILAFQRRFLLPPEKNITARSLTFQRLQEELDNPANYQLF